MDRLESMSVLVSVVAAGSFSGASRKLRMPLPTVSRKVSELESHLDAKLLTRSTRKLVLTAAGQRYVAACRRILDEIADAERTASGEYQAPRGELVLTAPVVLGRLHVLPVTTEFLAAYPDVDVRLVLTDRPLDLLEEHLDLAVRIGTLPESRLVAARVGEVRSVVCASPGFFRRHRVPKSPQDLERLDCVTFTGLPGAQSWAFAGGQTVQVRSRLAVNTAEAAVDAAIADVGITRVLSYQVAEAVRRGELELVLVDFETPPLPVSLVRTPDTVLTAKLRAFLDFAATRLRKRLAGPMRG